MMEKYDLSIDSVMTVMERMLIHEFKCNEKEANDITGQISDCIIDFLNGDHSDCDYNDHHDEEEDVEEDIHEEEDSSHDGAWDENSNHDEKEIISQHNESDEKSSIKIAKEENYNYDTQCQH